jgi:DNA mismatch endonuclease, patch repair protein
MTLRKLVRDLLGRRIKLVWNAKGLPGKPDVYIPSRRVAIFVDGCFFHFCPHHGHLPKSNVKYWRSKLARNAKRDRRTEKELRDLGISVARFWEHELQRE